MNPTGIREDAVSIPGHAQWVKDLAVAVSCAMSRIHSSDLVCCGVGQRAAAALVQPLAWEPPYAMDVALKDKK